MVRVDKIVKLTRDDSKIRKIVKHIAKSKKKSPTSKQISIRTYKKQLKKKKRTILAKSKKQKNKSKYISIKQKQTLNIANKNDKILLSQLESPIIVKPEAITIPDMEIPTNTAMIQTTIPILQPIISKQQVPQAQVSNLNNISAADTKYTIAIPSYNRQDTIQTHTLAVLNRHNIKPSHITIFVANQEQHDIYKAAIPQFLYNNLVIGVLGLKNQRNFISDYYPEGAHIVEMDDDIKQIVQLVTTQKVGKKSGRLTTRKTIKPHKTTKPIEDLDGFIIKAFEMCTELNIFLWGVYPLINAYFMTDKITKDLRFIVGPMWGMINRHRQDLKLTIDEKENSERTLQYWVADGAVLRFNYIGIDTKYYKNKGGMQSEGKNRKEEALKSVYYLNKMYPTLTKISLTKKSGMPEIKMIHK
jgi:hypothetical protein